MAKKIEINENWEPVEVEDLDNLFVVIFKQGSFDQGYVEAFDTDDVLMQSAYDSLAKQYGDCGCDELTKIYLIKIPNTDQTVNMCNTGLFNGNCCDPHVIEATRDLFNRADCEQLSCWEGCGLTEGIKYSDGKGNTWEEITDPYEAGLNLEAYLKDSYGSKIIGADSYFDGECFKVVVEGVAGEDYPGDFEGIINDWIVDENIYVDLSFDYYDDHTDVYITEQKYDESLKENKKKKKPYSSAYCGFTDPALNIKHFNKCMGTDGLQNPDAPHLVVGDTLPNGPVANAEGSDGTSDAGSGDAGSSAGEGGAMGESLTEAVELNKDFYDRLPGMVCETMDQIIEKYGEEPWFKEFWNEYREHINTTDTDKMKMPGYFLKKYTEKNESLTEDIEKELQIQNNENIEKDIEELKPPIDPEYFPNNMGINLSSVKKEIWVQQDDGQLKSIEVEFDPAEDNKELKESFYDHFENEVVLEYKNLEIFAADIDKFINFGDFEFKVPADDVVEYLYDFELDLPEHEDKTEEDIFKYVEENLEQMVKKYDKELKDHYIEQAQEAAEHKYYEIRKAIKERDFLALNEAHLDYSTQLAKMKALEAGTRGFNAGSASLEKILYNYDICISHNLPKARKVMEDALRMHGWDSYIKPTKKQVKIADYNHILKPGYVNIAAAKTVLANKDNAQQLIKDYGNNLDDLLIILVIALGMKEAVLAGAIKDHIIKNFTVTLAELKEFLNKYFANPAAISSLNQIIHDCKESLVEDTAYSHKLMDKFEIPSQIKLLDQAQVEDFIKQLAPEELFRIGYATPLYFYSELDDKFDLVKATEMEGYTGLDYRDAVADQTVADHDTRVANAQRQIDTYKDGAQGHQLNKDGEKFSTSYRATNKLALNPEKSNEYVEYEKDADGNDIKDANGQKIIKTKIDMNKILFYPRVGSTPITHYYVDFHNGQGFKPIRREILVDTLYKFIMEVEKANDMGISKTDLIWIQKKGYGNIKKDSKGAIEAFYKDHPEHYAIWVYRKAEESNMSVEDYIKEHPHSPRWSMNDFRKKAKNLFDADAETVMAQDASTISGQELAAVKGMDREVKHSELKPQVRALYSNQVYFLEGKPGKFGSMLQEGLEENMQDPNNNRRYRLILADYDSDDFDINVEFGMQDPDEYEVENDLWLLKPGQTAGDLIIYLSYKCGYTSIYVHDEVPVGRSTISVTIDGKTYDPKNANKFKTVPGIDPATWQDYGNMEDKLEEDVKLDEAKRYVKRYYVRPLNIFCGNKEDIIQALIRAGDQNCSVYSLKNLADHEDVHLLKPSDIIYYWDDRVLYDKNHVQVMDYDLFVKHEEDRKKVGNIDAVPDATFSDMYDDRATEDDLKDKEVIANYKALNTISR